MKQETEDLEPHDLNVRDAGDRYYSVWVNQSSIDGSLDNVFAYKIENVSSIQQHQCLQEVHCSVSVEIRLKREFQFAFSKDPSKQLLVATSHHRALFRLVRPGVDEAQEVSPLRCENRGPRAARLAHEEGQPVATLDPSIRSMAYRADDESVGIGSD